MLDCRTATSHPIPAVLDTADIHVSVYCSGERRRKVPAAKKDILCQGEGLRHSFAGEKVWRRRTGPRGAVSLLAQVTCGDPGLVNAPILSKPTTSPISGNGVHVEKIAGVACGIDVALAGVIVGVTGGLYLALNLLGAGGGKPISARTIQITNATACAVWFVSAFFGGSVLNTIGPALTGFLGTVGYILYVGALWYFDVTGKPQYCYFSGVAIGLSAGLVFVTMGYMAISYSEENERGLFVTISVNCYAFVSAIGGLIPLIINRDSAVTAGVPHAVYIVFLVIMGCGALAALLLLSPKKVRRDNGEPIAVIKARSFTEELRTTFHLLKDWKLLLMFPAFIPGESYIVYGGSVNAYHNNLRTRCLLSFIAVLLQIVFSIPLQVLLDNKRWKRKTRALAGLVFVGVPMISAWTWEVIRTRNYDRHAPPEPRMDWADGRFGGIFVLFMMNFVSTALWTNLIYYFLGTLSNDPRKAANYTGVFRSILGAGEAINFGVDSIAVPYIKEAGVILAFLVAGVGALLYLALFHIEETMYFKEEEVIIPEHILNEKGLSDTPGTVTIAHPGEGIAMHLEELKTVEGVGNEVA